MMALTAWLLCPFPPSPGSEGVCQLGHRKDAFPGVALNPLLSHPPQQGYIVLLHRLLVAPLAELTHPAVVVEMEPCRQSRSCHVLQPSQDFLGLLVIWI